ncbi:MAG: hypothetical protein ACOCZE_04615 [Planctomycetota bacterium]
MHRVSTLLVLTCLAATAAAKPVPEDLGWLRKACDDGALGWQSRDKNVYLTELSTGNHEKLGKGWQPEFSPDSGKLAWIRDDQAVGRLRKGDPTVHVIADKINPIGGVHWISNDEVVVLKKDNKWYRVKLDGRTEHVEQLTKLGRVERECDVKLRADGSWALVSGRNWKTSTGRKGRVPGTCSVSLSPDGRSITSLHPGHKKASLTAIEKGGYEGALRWSYTGARRNKGFDNHRWSSNDPRYVSVCDEGSGRIAVVRIRDGQAVVLGGKNGEYADFTVGSGKTSPWPGTAVNQQAAGGEQAEKVHPKTSRIRAKLLAKTPTPNPVNYPQALVVYRYKVEKVLSGPLKAEQVLVAHWAVRDRKEIVSLTGRRTGQVVTLQIEDFDAHPDLARHRRAEPDNEDALDMPLWFAVESDD